VTQTHQTLLIKAYADFDARDIDAVLSVMHPDVAWANGMEGGHVHGYEAVREYWTRQWKLVDPYVEPRGFQHDERGRIVVDVHQVCVM
jgi:ketosteroid isomerase-like protein